MQLFHRSTTIFNMSTLVILFILKSKITYFFIGILVKDPHEVFDFIVKLLTQAKRRQVSTCTETLYHCLNRTILFLLSRGTETIPDVMVVLDALHKITTHRYVNNYPFIYSII